MRAARSLPSLSPCAPRASHLAPRAPRTLAPRTLAPSHQYLRIYNLAVHRFFAPDLDPANDTVVLPRDEAEHLTRVLRLSTGDTVAVFDGRGREFLAQVALAARRDVRVRLLSPMQAVREPAVAITLVQAVLKTDKMDDLVR